MLIKFDNAELRLFDFSIYKKEKWFDTLEQDFNAYFITNGSLLWGNYVGIEPDEIYEKSIPIKKINRALDLIA
jgi:hypothetical protein